MSYNSNRTSTKKQSLKIVAEHLVAQYSAIKMLHSRVQMVLAYIKDVESGKLEANHEILREIYALSSRLPVVQGSTFREEYFTVRTIRIRVTAARL